MLSFSLNDNGKLMDKSAEIWDLIVKNEKYFRKIHGAKADVAMQDVWWHIVCHRDRSVPVADLASYMKRTCVTIYRTKGDIPVSVFDDEKGEVSMTFVKCVTPKVCEETYEDSEDMKALMRIFTSFYLIDSDKFNQIYKVLIDSRENNRAAHLDKNDKYFNSFSKLFQQYKTSMIFDALGVFKLQISKNEQKSRIGKSTKSLNIIPFDKALLMQIEDVDIICGNKVSRLNLSTLRMQPEVDLDHKHWSLNCKNKGVVRICIDKYMDDIINNIIVEEGKNTPYIRWFNSSYIMTAPSGIKSSVNETRENFIEYCRKELICNLIRELNVIGVSDSYVYALPNRKLSFKSIELIGCHRTIVLELEDVFNENL